MKGIIIVQGNVGGTNSSDYDGLYRKDGDATGRFHDNMGRLGIGVGKDTDVGR